MELLYYLFHKIKHFTKNVKKWFNAKHLHYSMDFLKCKEKNGKKFQKITILCKFLCFLPLNITECFEKSGLMNKNI